jgi:ribonuclease-3
VQPPVAPALEALDEALGVEFADDALREAALTHRSFAFEQNLGVTNERLEFLGDSVLGLVVTDLAYRSYPTLPEGQLAKLRAAVVNMQALADVARALGVGDLVLLGKGEEQSGGLFGPRLEAYVRGEGDRDFKTILQELASQRLRSLPIYEVAEAGPDHQKQFTATVAVAGEQLGTGAGRTKKEAEQHAAREAYERLRERGSGETP